MEESAHDFQSSDNRAKQSRILYNFENFARIIPTLYNVLYIYIYVRRVKFPRSKCQNIFKVSSFERKRKKRLGLAGNCVNIWLILRWTRAYRIFAFQERERKRRRGGKKWGSFSQPRNLRLFPSSRHFHPSTSVPLVFRFGAETMKSLSPLAIASKANAPPVYIRPPLFPHFSIRPFYFVSTAVHPKWYQRFFPPLRFRPFFAPLSPFLSLSLELFLRYLSPFHRFEFFFSKRFFDRALPNFIPSCINICARIDK